MKLNHIHTGDAISYLLSLEPESVDSVLTDPPADLCFMNAKWDDLKNWQPKTDRGRSIFEAMRPVLGRGTGFLTFTVDYATALLRCLKPGAHGFVWAIPKTCDLTQMGLRMAGFEIVDVVSHIFGSGFPKSHDISKGIDRAAGKEREVIGVKSTSPERPITKKWSGSYGKEGHKDLDMGRSSMAVNITAPATPAAETWNGWGTQLAPAVENWILIRKPNAGTFAQNALNHGVAGLCIDGGRVSTGDNLNGGVVMKGDPGYHRPWMDDPEIVARKKRESRERESLKKGRWPSNLILDTETAKELDLKVGIKSSGKPTPGTATKNTYGEYSERSLNGHPSTGGPSRYFYQAKPTGKEKDEGLQDFHWKKEGADWVRCDKSEATATGNIHSTVKPLSLIRQLLRLLKTPTGGICVDPFAGSGTIAAGCAIEGITYIGSEMRPQIAEMANARAAYWLAKSKGTREARNDSEVKTAGGQFSIFDK